MKPLCFLLVILHLTPVRAAQPWVRHTIDASSRGADGVRPIYTESGVDWRAIAVGWEESGLQRVYLRPEAADLRRPWPSVTVGRQGSPEDAVLIDLDQDGSPDVVSACEGATRSLFIHWAPRGDEYLQEERWVTQSLPQTKGRTAWMFILPMQIDGRHGLDLVVGSKGEDAEIGWLAAPNDPRDLAAWTYHPLHAAGWIMSLVSHDMDRDGDLDIVYSDRRGPGRGVYWLENPSPLAPVDRVWQRHPIGATDREVMFLTLDSSPANQTHILTATLTRGVTWLRPSVEDRETWTSETLAVPEFITRGKSTAVGDLDLDGQLDLVFSSESHDSPGTGIVWTPLAVTPNDVRSRSWRWLSDMAGQKFDLLQLVDVDEDGDLDVITTEEREGLGTIWYENPHR